MGISTFHDNVFSLFLTFCNKFHEVHLDNIYISSKFAHLSYTHHNCVKVKGVCQTGSRGIPIEALKTKFHDNKTEDRVR